MKIKMLTQEDWKIWKSFRLESLKNSTENFGSSYEEELSWSDLDFQNALTKSDIFGVFIDNSLVSCAGFYSLNSTKTKHRGVVWGLYTQPEYRRQGIASALIQTIINHAKSRLTQLQLTYVTTNFYAVAFYQRHGFKIYGTEPRALKIGDTFFDEHLMILDLSGNIYEKNSQDGEPIPSSNYRLYKNIKNAFEIIAAKLYAYNKQCVPATQKPESIDIHYIIKENGTIIGGICANIYTWKILYIELLFIDEAYRKKSLASYLLQQVEKEAGFVGVKLVHTDTYEFQAKDFYLKHGYEVFGVLDDCPEGYKRYYLKKML